jgi:hypothetical protein
MYYKTDAVVNPAGPLDSAGKRSVLCIRFPYKGFNAEEVLEDAGVIEKIQAAERTDATGAD